MMRVLKENLDIFLVATRKLISYLINHENEKNDLTVKRSQKKGEIMAAFSANKNENKLLFLSFVRISLKFHKIFPIQTFPSSRF